VRDIIDSKVDQQRRAKLRKGSAGGTTNPYRRIAISPNKARFRQLSSFIPAYPMSSNFPRWAIKTSYNLNTILSNAIDSDSEYEVQNMSNPTSRMNIDFDERNSAIRLTGKLFIYYLYCLYKYGNNDVIL
jgi:hypothetical protein